MKIRKRLEKATVLNQSIELKSEVLKKLEESIAITSDGVLMKKLITRKKKIKAAINKDIREKIQIYEIIDKMKESSLKSVLEYKYICGLSTGEIAEVLNYTPRHILRMHTKAIEELEKYFKSA